jgi:hypothetical protein
MIQEDNMRKLTSVILMFVLLLSVVGPEVAAAAPANSTIPVFYIDSVVRDTSVTITTYNFPSNNHFDVLMGYMHTQGINGYYVTNVSSGAGGTLTFTFTIPSQLHGQHQISIRLQSSTGSGYYAYNWFYNNTYP